jgi:hypothetical protein
VASAAGELDLEIAERERDAACHRAFGARLTEFMLIGGATLLLFPLSWWLQAAVGLDATVLAAGFITFHAAYVLNDPHFSVTYLLFYRDVKRRALSSEFGVAQRVRYWLAGFVAPLALVAWAALAIALRSAQALGWMIQLMFLLVGWHYAKQGFGVLSVLAARRGAPLASAERRVLLLHAYAAWAHAWANPAMPAGLFEEKGVVYSAVARPRWLELGTGALLALSGAAVVYMLASRWRAERRLPPLAPLAGFLVTLWSWTIYSAFDPLVQYFIPALHSVQYLYFVWLLKHNEARAEEGPPHFGRSAGVRLTLLGLSALGLGWLLFRGVPTALDELLVPKLAEDRASLLGATPFFAAFFVAVNLHHYLMDAVIWRRENPDLRHLRAGAAPAR